MDVTEHLLTGLFLCVWKQTKEQRKSSQYLNLNIIMGHQQCKVKLGD